MKFIRGLLGIIFSLSVIIILLISSVEIAAYKSPDFYSNEYIKYNVTSTTNISHDDLLEVTDQMMSYLRGDRDQLADITTTINGVPDSLFFNEQDCLHMSDVRNLFVGALWLRRILLIICFVSILALIVSKTDLLLTLAKSMISACILFVFSLITLAFFASRNFTKFFTIFHHIFFTNDLWLFDARTDIMINMLPEGFFMDMALRIGLLFFGFIFILLILSIFILVYKNKTKQITSKNN